MGGRPLIDTQSPKTLVPNSNSLVLLVLLLVTA